MAIRRLKKGELLFSEGQMSKSMYFVQSGQIRLFKKKGVSAVELGVIHRGEVIGEMGFLDGGLRSAYAEALYETELVEITGDKMAEISRSLPPWLLVLLKTVVNRLRSANTKIKYLEDSSTQIVYGKNGPLTSYVFLGTQELMRLTLGLYCVGSKAARSETAKGRVRLGQIEKTCSQILGIQAAKVAEYVSLLERYEIVKLEKIKDQRGERIEAIFNDLEFLDSLLNFINEENGKEQSKKLKFSERGVRVLLALGRHVENYPVGENGLATVNLGDVLKREAEQDPDGRIGFSKDDFAELVGNKIATELEVRDPENMFSQMDASTIRRLGRIQAILQAVDALNSAKRQKIA